MIPVRSDPRSRPHLKYSSTLSLAIEAVYSRNSFISGKINVGGEFGVEIGGEANAYLGFSWKGFGLRKRLGIGLAGGGRIGVLWDASVHCNKAKCDISGPIDFFAEAYMRAQLPGFNMEVGISGTTTMGTQTVSFANPLYSLLD